jgi:glycosyltransferase involved in cell wall biosynthesis
MNILFTHYALPIPDIGGVERVTHLLMSGLEKRGHKCYFLHCYRKGRKTRLIYNNEPIKNLSAFLLKKEIQLIINQDGNKPEFALKYNKIDRHNGIKLISVLHNRPGYEMLTLSKKNNHWLKRLLKTCFFPLYRKYRYFCMEHSYKVNYKYSSLLLLLVNDYIDEYLQLFKWAKKIKLTSIANPLTFNLFIDKKEITQKEKTVLVVSRLSEIQKRISICLKVWKSIVSIMPEWKLVIVGDGPDKNQYERYVKEQSINNVFFVGQQKSYEYYKKASVFMMTSAFEGFPMVLLEAAQMGVIPVVMDSFKALHTIIENNINGVIVPNNDVNAFTQALLWIMKNDEKRMSMAEIAVESVRQFNLDSVLDKWEDLFNQLMNPVYD